MKTVYMKRLSKGVLTVIHFKTNFTKNNRIRKCGVNLHEIPNIQFTIKKEKQFPKKFTGQSAG